MPDNEIHPTAIVAPEVQLGAGNVIGPYAVLEGPMTIGDGNWFGPHCCIGAPSQWTGVSGREMAGRTGNGVRIGDGNVVREYVSVHQGTDRVTTIEDECYFMAYAHVPHDAYVAANATLTNAVQMAGHTHVGTRANLGLGTVVHQRKVIGAYVMVGMQSVVTSHLPPGVIAFGSPAKPRGINRIGLERAGFSPSDIDEVAAAFEAGRRPESERMAATYEWFDARVAGEP